MERTEKKGNTKLRVGSNFGKLKSGWKTGNDINPVRVSSMHASTALTHAQSPWTDHFTKYLVEKKKAPRGDVTCCLEALWSHSSAKRQLWKTNTHTHKNCGGMH